MTPIKKWVFTFVLLLPIITIFAQETNLSHKDSLNLMVEKYYALNLAIFKADSEVSDIDELFKLFTPDFTYVHPKYGGVYSRKDLYDGYVNNQKRGGYNGSIINIKVVEKIVGLNAVAVNKRFVTKKDSEIEEGDEEMTLFEFKGGKISKIFEYW